MTFQYKYSIDKDTAAAGVEPTSLTKELKTAGFSSKFSHIETGDDELRIYFTDELSEDEEFALFGVIETHAVPSRESLEDEVFGSPITVGTSGDTEIHKPTEGLQIRLHWLGLVAPSSNTKEVFATISIGDNEIYRWALSPGGTFMHGFVREGDVDEALKINLNTDQVVHVNIDLEEFYTA